MSLARIRSNANDAEAYFLLSKAEVSFGNVEDAIAPAEKAVQIDPSQASYHAAAAEAYALSAQRVGVMKQMLYVHRLKHELQEAFAIDANDLDALLVSCLSD